MYARAKDIEFSSAKKLKEKLDQKIEDLQQPKASNHTAASSSQPAHAARIAAFDRRKWTRDNGSSLFEIKAVALSLIDTFADQFIDQSHFVPFVSELLHTDNLNLGYSCL